MKSLHEGLKTHSPKQSDASMKPPSSKTTTGDNATRSSTTPNQKPLGPRCA